MINFETAESINQNIVQLIDSIDMFVIKNFEDLKIDNSKEKLELYEKDIQTKDKNEMTTSQLMAKLISNRSNCCSQELTKELQKIVFKLSNSIDRVDIKNLLNEDLLELEFDKMNDEQFDLIKDLSRYFITVIFVYQFYVLHINQSLITSQLPPQNKFQIFNLKRLYYEL
ncbi:kinase domain protein (macronuclear) [Tetrahymena thermophila SB210]|uniref:Kinase domain protein n=1 Tax=Tetrahymena thermophila (strain SB210) TaxID=312017 RepID=Q224G5_TETTS|nr:kinase domain protein [Tetrahymena thermophila SB210]EAR80681.1 kinase domain protein [Tetrahymena thermophila SB210]|eukprot:XP_001028344.1 kinase domain protein [Tetrahymena thermophila SB210]